MRHQKQYDVRLVHLEILMARSKFAGKGPVALKAAARGALKVALARSAPVQSRLQSPSASTVTIKRPLNVGYVMVKLGNVTVQAKTLGVAAGRIALPKMIQESMGLEDAFLVRNVKNPNAPEVLVINPAALDNELRQVRPNRTLGEIVDSLPFGRRGVPSLKVRPLPDAGIQNRLRVPNLAAAMASQYRGGGSDADAVEVG